MNQHVHEQKRETQEPGVTHHREAEDREQEGSNGEAIRVTPQMQQRTEVMFQQFFVEGPRRCQRVVETGHVVDQLMSEKAKKQKSIPNCKGPVERDRRAYPIAETSTRNKRASPTAGRIGKENDHAQLQGPVKK